MREHIAERLRSTALPDDPVVAATRDIPPGTADAWFRLPLQPAAVLLALLPRDDDWTLLLTERNRELTEHPGQVALPGGRVEARDTDLRHTALRESHEEVGLDPSAVEVVGFVPPQPVISGYAVVPVVGFVTAPFTPVLDPREVHAVFEVPLSFLLHPDNCRESTRERNGVELPVWEYQYEDQRIWGATAKIIREFVALLR